MLGKYFGSIRMKIKFNMYGHIISHTYSFNNQKAHRKCHQRSYCLLDWGYSIVYLAWNLLYFIFRCMVKVKTKLRSWDLAQTTNAGQLFQVGVVNFYVIFSWKMVRQYKYLNTLVCSIPNSVEQGSIQVCQEICMDV